MITYFVVHNKCYNFIAIKVKEVLSWNYQHSCTFQAIYLDFTAISLQQNIQYIYVIFILVISNINGTNANGTTDVFNNFK